MLGEVAGGVWVTTSATWRTTTTVVVDRSGRCLVVDPALSVAEVGALAAEIAARGWTPVAGFATHPHWDHVLWSRALGPAPRWATPSAVASAHAHHAALVREADAVAPGHDHTLTGHLTPLPPGAGDLPWSGPRVVVVPHSAHAVGSAALAVPHAALMVAGDVLSDEEIPLLELTAADPVGHYTRGLDVLERAAQEHRVSRVVPGHGHVGGAAALRDRLTADRAYLDGLATGRGLPDERLASPEQAAEHARQVRRLRQL